MEDAEDFDSVAAHAVGDQVRSIGDHQLAGALDAPGAAQGGMLSEQFYRSGNGFNNAGSGSGMIAGDEGGFGIEVGQRPFQPAAHPRAIGHVRSAWGWSTSSPRGEPRTERQTLPGQLPPAPCGFPRSATRSPSHIRGSLPSPRTSGCGAAPSPNGPAVPAARVPSVPSRPGWSP